MGQSATSISEYSNSASERSNEERIKLGSTFSSDHERVLATPLNKCTNLDLLILCQHYKFENKKVLNALKKTKEFNGADYEELYKLTKKEDIEKERTRLIDVVNEYVHDRGDAKFFVYQVVFKKFTYERSFFFARDEAQDNNGPTTTKTTFEKLSVNSTKPFVSSASSAEIKEYDLGTPYENCKLSEFERKGVELVKLKLNSFFKKKKTTKEALGCSESLDIEAQTHVCEDRFLNYNFIRPALKDNNSRIVDVEAILRVKLLVSTLNAGTIAKKALATLCDILDVNNYGIVHTGLLIGEWKIEWFDNSLVHVSCDSDKKLDASNTIAAIDIGEIVGAEKVKQALKLITKISCNYNATKEYARLKENCQHFVSDLLDALQLTIPVSETFKTYFDKLKKGETDRTFYVNENLGRMLYACNIKNPYTGLKNITFESRKDLDVFCHFLDKIQYFETEEGKNDFWLLKAFDRSFVLIGKNETCLSSDSTGDIKENGFFTTNGGRDEDSISKIKYSIKDVDFSDCTLKR